jgi:hypothetical protein
MAKAKDCSRTEPHCLFSIHGTFDADKFRKSRPERGDHGLRCFAIKRSAEIFRVFTA